MHNGPLNILYPRDDLWVSIGYRLLPENVLINTTSVLVKMGSYFE
jgi:hypothetical protein